MSNNNLLVRLNKEVNNPEKFAEIAGASDYLPNLRIAILPESVVEQASVQNFLQSTKAGKLFHNGSFDPIKYYQSEGSRRMYRWDRKGNVITWGLGAIQYDHSRHKENGNGMRVAVLDTGVCSSHRDLKDNLAAMKSFVGGNGEDGNGHGTHCAGTILASLPHEQNETYYSVSPKASLYAGKVLTDGGGGTFEGILRGIEWAVENRVNIVSMSLGTYRDEFEEPGELFNDIATECLYGGIHKDDPNYTCLFFAAAGNESSRPRHVAPIGIPAACRGFQAVAAIDKDMKAAYFSCGNVDGYSPLHISAPGVDVLSAWPGKNKYNTISGTSMACPHAAGVAAAWWSWDLKASALDIQRRMEYTARKLGSERDFGPGVAQLP